jgi:hypothetical protein
MNSITLFFNNLTKWKKLVLLASPVITLLLSMKIALIGLTILIFIDLVTGIGRNLNEWGVKANPFKKQFWKSIKSYLLRKTWRKAYEYGLGIIVVAVFESLVLGTTSISFMEKKFTLSELAVIIPAIIEVWSIFENLEQVSKQNVLKRLITLLPKKVQNLFTGETKKEIEEDYEL